MNTAETINFHGQELLVATSADGERWVAIRPVCEGLGVATFNQQTKIESDQRFSRHDIMSTGADGKRYKMLAIPVSQLNGWLFSINANKVKPEVRENLLTYQRECQEVLFRHFMPQGGTSEEVVGLIRSLQGDLKAVRGDIENVRGEVTDMRASVREEVTGMRTDVDELRELVHIAISDKDAKEIRDLIKKVKAAKGMDGRAIIGHVRKTLGTSGVYDTPNLRQVKNVLRNMLGQGVLGAAQ